MKPFLYDINGKSISGDFTEGVIYYIKEEVSDSLELDAKKGGIYNCKVTVNKNRYSKSGTTEDRTIIWPAGIQFKTIKEGETNPFSTPLIAKSTNEGYELFDNALDDFKNYIEKINDKETGYFNSEDIDIALSGTITFEGGSNITTMPLKATNGPLNDLTQNSTSTNNVTILKPLGAITVTIGDDDRYFTISSTGGEFYDNYSHQLTNTYSGALEVTIVVTNKADDSSKLTFTDFETFNNSTDINTDTSRYNYSLTIKDKANH